MKIAWFCIPAYGHTNPTLALVRELSKARHSVYYFSFDLFKEAIEKAGAIYICCDECTFEMDDQKNSDRVGKDKAFAMELLVSSTLAMDEMTSKRIAEIQPDLIVADSMAYWGKLAAMKHHIPFVSSTTTFAFNRYSARYIPESVWSLVKMLFDLPKIRKQIRRLLSRGYPVKGMLQIVQNDNETPTLVYTSSYFQPCSETFSSQVHFIGPSIRPVEKPFTKTAAKTVYISLGTVNRNEEFLQNCLKALAKTDWQVIISMKNGVLPDQKVPEHIEIYESVDQMAVLQIADAFITHCGMNSVNEALYFQVPLVLFPQTPEQAAVAKRVQELGAGVRLSSTAPENILQTLELVMEEGSYKDSAAAISQSFQEAGGMAEAVSFLEEIACRSHSI